MVTDEVHKLSGLMGGMSLYGSPRQQQQQRSPVATSSISLVSHDHGRARREERGITRRELQEAIKHGKQERANPGRDGSQRWRYTHNGVVYITDSTSRHEITSWRDDGPETAAAAVPGAGTGAGGGGAHFVLVVDASGSMRRHDVPGYMSRLAAVYSCLATDLVSAVAGGGGSGSIVSLVEMQDAPRLLLDRQPMNPRTLAWLKERAQVARAARHGNYLPALQMAFDITSKEQSSTRHVVLLFLSDGAPSDQGCTPQRLSDDCVAWVMALGRLCGRDRTSVCTVAFGPPGEDYSVLRCMAAAVPRGTFQKLGLSAALLSSAFSTLATSVNTLLTSQATPSPSLTLRRDIKGTHTQQDDIHWRVQDEGWDVYAGTRFHAKCVFDAERNCMVDSPFCVLTDQERRWTLDPGLAKYRVQGVARAQAKLSEGAERVVFRCCEVLADDLGRTGLKVGPRLVAKETKYEQQLNDAGFHLSFCRVQAEAERLAALFNRRLQGSAKQQVHFLACAVYKVSDAKYPRGVGEILVEPELEGRYTKWNDNNGGVHNAAVAGGGL